MKVILAVFQFDLLLVSFYSGGSERLITVEGKNGIRPLKLRCIKVKSFKFTKFFANVSILFDVMPTRCKDNIFKQFRDGKITPHGRSIDRLC